MAFPFRTTLVAALTVATAVGSSTPPAGATDQPERPATDLVATGDTAMVAAAVPAGFRKGYWMVERSGRIWGFGDAAGSGSSGADVVAIATNATGTARWTLGVDGVVRGSEGAPHFGNLDLAALQPGESPSALSVKPDGTGYWVFTNRGRAVAFGTAQSYGDLLALNLNGPVVASVATPSGLGYYMVASDGGVFAFGDAAFKGSMGGKQLNGPVVGIAPDPDNDGYWLVASDGGIFAFNAPFKGSMGGSPLNRPMIGAVAYGDGYLMVASDGGIFNYSSQPFLGSLGGNPPPSPIVDVAAFASYQPGALDPVSVKTDGTNGAGNNPDVTADGLTVAFSSLLGLVPGDTNGRSDVYVQDRVTGALSLVSVSSSGSLGALDAFAPSVSADGRYVAFVAPANTFGGAGNQLGVWLRDRVAGTTQLLTNPLANNLATRPSVSDDGGVVAFTSFASNQVPGDTNATSDVFVWERATGAVRRASLTPPGGQLAQQSDFGVVSGDGSVVAFVSGAAVLAQDIDPGPDLYVRTLATGATTLVSAMPNATAGGGVLGFSPALSTDGTNIAFASSSANLVPGDTNAVADVFVRHVPSATTFRVSVTSAGDQGNGASFAPTISANGARVAFLTDATNLVSGDVNGDTDVVLRARLLGVTRRVSEAPSGAQLDGTSASPSMSGDGRTVAFQHVDAVVAKFVG